MPPKAASLLAWVVRCEMRPLSAPMNPVWPLDGRDAEANGAQSNGCGAPQQMAPNGVEVLRAGWHGTWAETAIEAMGNAALVKGAGA